MAIDRNTLDTLNNAGIGFWANLRIPGGGRDIVLKPQNVEKYLADKDGFAAEHFGLTKEQYQDWVANDGYVQCSAHTTSGSRCKNHVSGGSHYKPEDWKKMQGEYCATHGGPGSTVK
ncbi:MULTISPECIES: hypothetical protein [unclassified Agrobacterium]|uniref:hypothetical protein n=1 Tax=unclassified Agrobacterium TaxID=2632611 RepID=UPI002446B68A|nr:MULTISPECIES: hypothetical protein [unclassified Agrobacterium]MDH0614215.1 hypothetical protein [Agrobacterium sp. GD03872]MDH0695490.1 hypothetical protein [Agrobacterium sp. GD03871]MDH1058392.1 hypothetical protein [Agrobacterium sp. GD03992]MDH2209666.1 hypothetical protein [Agrobacterium sp. GD03643]MDH2219070.1 hypothetical protein [Agrobacterium sp. GD03638]